ncbi:gamma-aminobutyrate transaminase POP2 [Cucumis melo var. makuwa]|uniref:Gamma-aminobutyrate transaminase POP2 n=1 Tax=Cucumis melo var. makuwa TaxID=1194695 RepID=A0A5D3DT15_CUCMM|nr:gamma-aminobutyrate transaminase POP2 [Cucumis melo var. makuwa]
MSTSTISSFSSNYEETDAPFLEFSDKLNNAERLKRYVHKNDKILMTIAPGAEKPISLYVVRLSRKLYRGDYHRHFKKYHDSKHAHANPLHILVGRLKDWHFLCDHYMSHAFQGAEDAHNQILELQSQLTPEGSQPLFGDEIYEKVLSRRLDYSKGLGCGSKSKFRKSCASSFLTLFLQAREFEDAKIMIEQQIVVLEEAKRMIEEHRKTSELLTSQMEEMKKIVEEMSRAQKGP